MGVAAEASPQTVKGPRVDAKVKAFAIQRPEGVGMPGKRREDRRLLDGRGEYLGDLIIPGALEVASLRSPVAHARLRGVEIPAHRRGAVFIAQDFDWIK